MKKIFVHTNVPWREQNSSEKKKKPMIKLGTQTLEVPEDVFDMLKMIVAGNETSLRWTANLPSGGIWIDQLCINQRDTEGKRWQIGLMNQIYKYVSFDTMIWLGLPADESNLALELVANTHHDESFFDRLLEIDGQSGGAGRIRSKPPPPGELGKPVIDPRDPTPWKALRALLCREWWTRTWIIQEAILSNMHCRIVCGSASMTLFEFTQFHERFMARQSKHHLMPAYVRHVFRGIPFMEFVSRFSTITRGFRQ